MNFFAYISLGVELFSTVMQLIVQFKNPTVLDASLVWSEIQPILVSLSSITKYQINMQIAQEVTIAAVTLIKGKLATK